MVLAFVLLDRGGDVGKHLGVGENADFSAPAEADGVEFFLGLGCSDFPAMVIRRVFLL